uniref:LRRC8 pannexin-like TM region domain-containing protein n=1 Tax=Canis lupus familiaris TaxID=9615 RepID=A0A8I3NSJ4_CANLF
LILQECFTLAEVASLNDIQPTYRILKPWWDVFMDYLAVVMLMVVVCLPVFDISFGASAVTPDIPLRATYPHTDSTVPNQETKKEKKDPTGRKTNLDFQQYVFINQMCYHLALPWYSKYFPYLALIHTIILMVSSNFWFKYPKTCSKVEHFVSILGKCFESPWTTKALSETACEDSEENKQRITGAQTLPKHVSTSSDEGSPSASTPMINKTGFKFSAEKPVIEVPSMTILDKKDGEQAKALFEKVSKEVPCSCGRQ